MLPVKTSSQRTLKKLSPINGDHVNLYAQKWIAGLTFLVGFSITSFGEEFEQLNWFQIKFCQSIKYIGFDQPSPAGKLLAFGFARDYSDKNGEIHFYRWDLLTGNEELHVPIPPSEGLEKLSLHSVTMSNDGKRALIASGNHEVILFDVVQAKVLKRYSWHRKETSHAAFSEYGSLIAASDVDGRVWFWGEDATKPKHILDAIGRGIVHIKFVDNDTKIDIAQRDRHTLYDIETGKLLNYKKINPTLHRDIVSISSDGKYLVATGEEKFSYLYDRQSMELLWSFEYPRNPSTPPGFPEYIWGHAFSNNGKCVLGNDNHQLYTFDTETGDILTKQQINVGHRYMKFTPDDGYMISGGGCDVNVYKSPTICR